MMASRFTPAVEKEGAEVEGAKKEGGTKELIGINHLRLWSLQSKLGLAPLNRTCADGAHDDEVRRIRNRNGEVSKNPRDS